MIFIDGGVGFIAVRTCNDLLLARIGGVLVDNWNSWLRETVGRVKIMGGKLIQLVEGDIRNRDGSTCTLCERLLQISMRRSPRREIEGDVVGLANDGAADDWTHGWGIHLIR